MGLLRQHRHREPRQAPRELRTATSPSKTPTCPWTTCSSTANSWSGSRRTSSACSSRPPPSTAPSWPASAAPPCPRRSRASKLPTTRRPPLRKRGDAYVATKKLFKNYLLRTLAAPGGGFLGRSTHLVIFRTP